MCAVTKCRVPQLLSTEGKDGGGKVGRVQSGEGGRGGERMGVCSSFLSFLIYFNNLLHMKNIILYRIQNLYCV